MAQKKSATDNGNVNEQIEIKTVEEGFAILDQAVRRLSEDGISLEDSFSEFEKGMKVLKLVNEKIEQVEKKVRILNGEGSDEFQ